MHVDVSSCVYVPLNVRARARACERVRVDASSGYQLAPPLCWDLRTQLSLLTTKALLSMKEAHCKRHVHFHVPKALPCAPPPPPPRSTPSALQAVRYVDERHAASRPRQVPDQAPVRAAAICCVTYSHYNTSLHARPVPPPPAHLLSLARALSRSLSLSRSRSLSLTHTHTHTRVRGTSLTTSLSRRQNRAFQASGKTFASTRSVHASALSEGLPRVRACLRSEIDYTLISGTINGLFENLLSLVDLNVCAAADPATARASAAATIAVNAVDADSTDAITADTATVITSSRVRPKHGRMCRIDTCTRLT
eukprot:6200840-Pleurochrysis_carterae.AAC.4